MILYSTMDHISELQEHQDHSKTFCFMLWKLCNVCMSVFFSLATYVQINDPDAGWWMVGYAVPAFLCLCVGIRPHLTESWMWRSFADVHLIISSAVVGSLGWTLYKERITNIFQEEEGREFSGLSLTVVWLLLCRHSGRSPAGALRAWTAVAITAFPLVAWLYYYINKELRDSWPSHCKTAI